MRAGKKASVASPSERICAETEPGYGRAVLRFGPRLPWSLVAVAALATGACRKEVDDPGRAVVTFLEDLRHADEDLDRAKRALAALPEPSRRDLDERAKRASVVLGRRVEPAELLVDAFVVSRFEPVRTTSDVRGERAVVELFGANEAVEHARVTCVREGERWAVEIPFSGVASAAPAERPKP